MESSALHRNLNLQKIHSFYEALVLLKVLDSSALARNPTSVISSSKMSSSDPAICKFLDRLSWMCDYEPAGSTVCAIAAEAEPTATKFWVATKFSIAEKVRSNLEWILAQLATTYELSLSEADHLERKISAKCISVAENKVKNYCHILCKLVEKVCGYAQASDAQLCLDLNRLANLAKLRIEICSAADQFRDSESLRRLSRKIASESQPSDWSFIRHYIGRLGSWHRAARTLVEFARDQPQMLRSFKVGSVTTPKTVHAPRADGWTNLQSVLQRMFPQDHNELTRGIECLNRLRKTDMAKDFLKEYTDKNFKPSVHVEAYLLGYLYKRDPSFAEGHRYIGCSKPSCYCCDLYFKNHPGDFMQRPRHGNLWLNWQPPHYETSRTQDHDESILDAMTRSIREDVRRQILSNSTRQPRLADSSTGLTLLSL